ncbi:hypothetical protein Hanom_Chr15g01392441 [Helianthus anomalus]
MHWWACWTHDRTVFRSRGCVCADSDRRRFRSKRIMAIQAIQIQGDSDPNDSDPSQWQWLQKHGRRSGVVSRVGESTFPAKLARVEAKIPTTQIPASLRVPTTLKEFW